MKKLLTIILTVLFLSLVIFGGYRISKNYTILSTGLEKVKKYPEVNKILNYHYKLNRIDKQPMSLKFINNPCGFNLNSKLVILFNGVYVYNGVFSREIELLIPQELLEKEVIPHIIIVNPDGYFFQKLKKDYIDIIKNNQQYLEFIFISNNSLCEDFKLSNGG
jgi:hypothetical protein